MNAPRRRSILSLASVAGTLVLLAGGSCRAPEHGGTGGGGDDPPDLAASLPADDMSDVPSLGDMSATALSHDMAKGTDMAKLADMAKPAARDVTFYVVADTHNDPAPEPQAYDERATVRAINSVAQNGQWPSSIGGTATGFAGGKIAPPAGVVFVGDLTGWGTAPTEIPEFRHYYEKGNSAESINYPAYLGLGNHDVDTAGRSDPVANAYRAQYWAWIDERHKGAGAPVPVGNFDAASHAYSWDVGGVHFVQLHRFAGDSGYGLPSSLGFLKADLASRAADGRPVFLFHHYGMDAFGTNGQWWNDADRNAYRDALRGYHVSAIFTGHSHHAEDLYTWQGLRVIQVNNAKAENGSGNNDGNGSFTIVRITDSKLDTVTCRWLDDQGHYELVAPWYSIGPDPGPALRGPGPRREHFPIGD